MALALSQAACHQWSPEGGGRQPGGRGRLPEDEGGEPVGPVEPGDQEVAGGSDAQGSDARRLGARRSGAWKGWETGVPLTIPLKKK